MTSHKFGGNHTKVKLEIVKLYIDFYMKALKKQSFKLIYIDPFAGSGECKVTTSRQQKDKNTIDAFENTIHKPPIDNTSTIEGSAKIALENDRIFYEYHFIENNHKRHGQLEKLKQQHSNKRVCIYEGDANQVMIDILQKINWVDSRAIIFIDPYGMETEWETLIQISNTKAVDLWYLFPLSGVYRQAANNYDKVDKGKAEAIDRMLGTEEWRTKFYDVKQGDMFDDEPILQRTAGVKDIARFAQERLNSIFATVPEPRILPDKGPPQFALFFAAANPNAASLALRGAVHILKNMSLS